MGKRKCLHLFLFKQHDQPRFEKHTLQRGYVHDLVRNLLALVDASAMQIFLPTFYQENRYFSTLNAKS